MRSCAAFHFVSATENTVTRLEFWENPRRNPSADGYLHATPLEPQRPIKAQGNALGLRNIFDPEPCKGEMGTPSSVPDLALVVFDPVVCQELSELALKAQGPVMGSLRGDSPIPPFQGLGLSRGWPLDPGR